MNSSGPQPAQVGQSTGKNAPARARATSFAETPHRFE
jgi:hypothetical protein